MKKDNIEKLFSSLEDFSKIPPDDLWTGIEEKLDRPKKKKGILFWWPVAASLLVGLGLLGTLYFHTNEANPLINPEVEYQNGVVNESRVADSVERKETLQKQQQIVIRNKNNDSRITTLNSADKEKENKKTVAENAISQSNKNQISTKNKEAVVTIGNKKTTVLENKSELGVKNNADFVQENKEVTTYKTEKEKKTSDSKLKENIVATGLEDNALTNLIKEEQNKEKIAAVEDKWSLQVFAGVNSSQNLKNQKALGNTIESQNGYSYGVKTNYKLNRRWAVSTGLKVSELGQQVANVSYVNSAQSLVNVSKASLSAPHEKGNVVANSDYIFIENSNTTAKNAVSSSSYNNFYETGDLSQKVRYIEMPMEVSYSILNKGKARINMNTGGFIGKVISNDVLLDNNSIGKNPDVNEVIFGTVLSSTLQYELFKKTKVFVEPGMNYYTQPVQNQNFNQFQLIFNFGLNVSF